MTKKSLMATMMLILFVLAATGTADAFGVEFAVGGWGHEPSGELGYKVAGANDSLDIEQDLNYDDETRLSARLSIDMPLLLPNIYLIATPMEFSATGQKQSGFKFGDIHFDPGTFYSETELNSLDVALYYGIPLLETATLDRLNLDLGINVRIYDYALEIRQDASGLRESESGFLPLPMVFLAIQFRPFEHLSLEAEGRGISYSSNDVYGFIGRVKVKIIDPLFVAGGYRYEKIKLDEEDVLADIEFKGLFLEAGFSF